MNTFSIIAIPLFAAAVVMLTLGATPEKPCLRYRRRRLMAATVVNAVTGMALQGG
ncbi:Uncharacterised protein [Klebsiella michiganensis]|uniref:Uncharacterized protein n=1 Tax=Klebsiella michiganensis TaxID=1134687 RepID=A0A7H4LTJ4_9ENTR|nr:Uncharacterised protein [Klebsiella michiganensis]